jgi:hypothetical protein
MRIIPNSEPAAKGARPSHAIVPSLKSPVGVLGRENELTRMRYWLERALTGERQIVFVTGEAGIGKTTLVQALLEQVVDGPAIWVARGQCLEHYGASEPYMPVLDGFSRLGRTQANGEIVECLRRHAPAWLAQMTSLIPADERESFSKAQASSGWIVHRSRLRLDWTCQRNGLRNIAKNWHVVTSSYRPLGWSNYQTEQ